MINDVLLMVSLRIKTMFKIKSIVVSLIVAIILSMFVILTFTEKAEDTSRIPIGVVDLDKSETSENVIRKLKTDKAVKLIEGNEKELDEMLDEGVICSLFVIKEGFEEKILAKETKGIVTHKYLKVNEYMSVLSDIFLSKMLDEVCMAYALDEYHKLENDYVIESDEEFKEFVEEVRAEYQALFSFDLKIKDVTTDKDVTDRVTNSIIYRRIIVVFIGILSMFIVLFAGSVIVGDNTINVTERMRISLVSPIATFIGNFIYLFIVSGIYAVTVAAVIMNKFGLEEINQKADFILLLLLFVVLVDLIFILLCIILKNEIGYQLSGTFVILIISIAGVMNIINIVLPSEVMGLITKTPMVLLNKGYLKLTVLGNATYAINELTKNIVIIFIIDFMLIIIKNLKFGGYIYGKRNKENCAEN